MAQSEHLLKVDDLSVDFQTESGLVHSVKNVSFHVDKGETVAIVGESGSGKSVTSLAIMRLLAKPSSRIPNGKILFEGKNLLDLSEKEMRNIRGNRISMIFQEPMTSLNPLFTVGDQIVEAITRHQNRTRTEAMEQAVRMLELVDVPEPRERVHYYPHQMSGGQRQRVMIAMALSCNPALLIADEPTTALDVIIQAQILDLMRKLQREIGTSVIFITHDLGVVAQVADRVIVMQNGVIVEQGALGDIFENPQHPYTKRLLGAVLHIDKDSPRPATTVKPPLLSIRGLRKWFPVKAGMLKRTVGHVKAVNDLSFDIKRGEVLGLVGESGSGKTTAGRSILRLIEPTAGKIDFDGTDVATLSTSELRLFRRKMQIIFQDPYASLNPRMTIGQILAEPLRIHGLAATRKERTARVEKLLEMVQLDPAWAQRYPHEFSGGQRQRIGIARALAVEPQFIVADECVSALDVSIRGDILALIKELRARLGLTMLFITHDLAVVNDICDRVAVMYKGDMVELASAYDLYRTPEHSYTKALLDAIPEVSTAREVLRH